MTKIDAPTCMIGELTLETVKWLRQLVESDQIKDEVQRDAILSDFLHTIGVDASPTQLILPNDGGIMILPLRYKVKELLDKATRHPISV